MTTISRRAASLIVFCFAFFFYLPSVTNNFVWDDEDIIKEDYVLRDTANALYLFTPQYWQRDFPGSEGRYRPLRALTFMAESKLWGESAAGYHLDNAVLHALSALALFWLALALGLGLNRSLFSALLFSVHPVAVESVAWIKNRTDILAALFCAVSLVLFIKSLEAPARRRLWALAALFSYFLALLSKESAAAYPLILLLYLLVARREAFKRALLLCAPYFALSAALLVFVLTVLRPGALSEPPSIKWFFLAFSSYLRLLFVPVGLNIERMLVTTEDFAGPVLLGFSAWAAVRSGDRRNVFFLLALAAALLPFLDTRLVSSRPIAEQRLYFPLMFFSLFAAALVPPAPRWKYAAAGLSAFLGVLSLVRMLDWRDPVRLWEATVRQSPGSARARVNLGLGYERKGRFPEAAAEYQKSMELDPSATQPKVNLAVLLARAGHREEASKLYAEAARLDPGNSQALLGLANELVQKGKPAEASDYALKVLARDPYDKEALNMLGVTGMMSGRKEGAGAYFMKVLAIDPADGKALYNLGALARMNGDMPLARSYFERLAGLEPENLDALNNLAILYDMAGDEAKAISSIKAVLERNKGYYQANYNLGLIYERKGMDLEALAEFSRVLELNPGHLQARRKAEELKRRLK